MAIFRLFGCAFCASIVLSSILTKAVRDLANRLGLATGPSSARHIHLTPVPRLGGAAIFLTFLTVFFGSLLLPMMGHSRRA